MKNVIQEYAWGSVDAIPRLLGTENPEKKPQAEIWMGAHGKAPSRLIDGSREMALDAYIQADPDAVLGEAPARQYGDLPFLFKVLAAGSPLSIQVHPAKKQAEEGFARENRLGIAPDAFNRNYKDDNHKPEIICALTEFWAMRGFRPFGEIVTRFEALPIPVFSDEIARFRADLSPRGLERFFHALMSLDGGKKKQFIRELTEASAALEGDEFKWVLRLYETYSDDAAIAAPLYLNLVRLEPGQALYLSAGELHAYLDGLGMELMASSDNVLRGGLTPKYIDRDELAEVVNFSGAYPEILTAAPADAVTEVYRTPSEEFELARISLRDNLTYDTASRSAVQILFLTEGSADFTSPDGEIIHAEKGESLFVPARAGSWTAAGDAVIYRASLPGDGVL